MKFNKVLPSLITLGNLFCGFLAIAYIADGKIIAAAALIFLGMVFDMLDGKVARLTNGTSDFGVQLDSLADMISFGVAPAFLIKVYISEICPARLAWIVGLLFVMCAALRLARFNTKTGHEESSHTYFEGLATPAASGVLASCVLITPTISLIIPLYFFQVAVLVLALLVSALMISKIPYLHFGVFFLKKSKIAIDALIGIALLVATLVEPRVFVILLCVAFFSYAFLSPVQNFLQKAILKLKEQEVSTN